MSADGSRCDGLTGSVPNERDAAEAASARALSAIRVRGGVTVEVARRGARSYPAVIAEHDGYRVRFPTTDDTCEAVLINTGGGLVGGDRADISIAVRGGAAASLTTQAAERVYRTTASAAVAEIALSVGPQARLAWLPQETILYSGGRLERRITADVAGDATLLIVEMIVFGRLAMGETVETGALSDQWRIRRDGRLVFAEAVKLDGPLRQLMEAAAVADGAKAAATVLLVAPDATDRLDGARAALATPRALAAVGAWNGLLSGRFLGHRAEDVRADVVRLATWLNGGTLPRSWSL